MIAKFPDFSNVKPDVRPDIESITAPFDPYSDFNFTSLFCWNTDDAARLAEFDGNLVMMLPDYLTGDPLYSLIGNHDIPQTAATLLERYLKLSLVPEPVAKQLEDLPDFEISEQPEHADYIFELAALSELAGQDYRGKRKVLHRFERAYEGQYRCVPLDIVNDTSSHQHILQTFEQWARERERTDEEVRSEGQAIQTLLNYASSLDVRVVGLEVDGKMIGFSIHEALQNGYTVSHFHKTLPSYEGADVYLTREASRELHEAGYRYVNWEQDLGLPGLQTLKQSYKPCKMLRKYAIKLR